MSGELTVVLGTPKTLESGSASSIANNALAVATTTYDRSSDGADFPDAEFVLKGTFGTAPTEGTVLALMVQRMDIDGTGDEEASETTRGTVVASFMVNNVTTAQYMWGLVRNVPKLGTYSIWNVGTGQTLSSGWTLKVTPRSLKPA